VVATGLSQKSSPLDLVVVFQGGEEEVVFIHEGASQISDGALLRAAGPNSGGQFGTGRWRASSKLAPTGCPVDLSSQEQRDSIIRSPFFLGQGRRWGSAFGILLPSAPETR